MYLHNILNTARYISNILILNMILIKRESNTYRKPKILANGVPKLKNMVNYENVAEAQTDM